MESAEHPSTIVLSPLVSFQKGKETLGFGHVWLQMLASPSLSRAKAAGQPLNLSP